MTEQYSGYEKTFILLGGMAFGAGAVTMAVDVAKGIEAQHNPTPVLELSSNPDEVIFKAANTSIQKGIKAAMEACAFKNAAREQSAEGISTVKVGCEQGTLKTTAVIVSRNAGQAGK